MFQRTCPTCGVDFQARGNRAKYCSQSCNLKVVYAAQKATPGWYEAQLDKQRERGRRLSGYYDQRPCVECGEPFSGDARRKYCTPTCANRASKRRFIAADPARWSAKVAQANQARAAKKAAWYEANREEQLQRRRDWYGANRDRVKAYRRQNATAIYAQNKARRDGIRLAGARDRIDMATLVDMHGGRCAYCGADCTCDPTLDHVTPISRGGTHTWDNAVLACRRCNSSKRNTPLLRWLFKEVYATCL